MNILLIVPLPPPLNGQTLTAQVFLDSIDNYHSVDVIDLKKNDHRDGFTGFNRIREILGVLAKTYKKQKESDIIYLHISESVAGNLRDLLIFLICRNNLSRVFLHAHGGSLKQWVFEKSKLLSKINKYFISRTSGVIVLGGSHVDTFSEFIENSKIHIVPNFSEDLYFSSVQSIVEKYKALTPLRILYLSNLIPGKGYEFLVDAFMLLSEEHKRKIEIYFAGGFGSEKDRHNFLKKIVLYDQLHYMGFVNGDEKKNLLEVSHILCFPSYLLEGQGICILEGYASGCAVITTGKSGISDIFTDNVNGYKIEERSAQSIADKLEKIIDASEELLHFGLHNFEIAKQNYRTSIYTNRLRSIMGI